MNKSSPDPVRWKSNACYHAIDPSEKSSLSWFLPVDMLCLFCATDIRQSHSQYPDVAGRLWDSAGAERTADKQRRLGAPTTGGVRTGPKQVFSQEKGEACMHVGVKLLFARTPLYLS